MEDDAKTLDFVPRVEPYELETLEFVGYRNEDGSIESESLGKWEDWPDVVLVQGSKRAWRFRLNGTEDRDPIGLEEKQESVAWYVNE
tara:strand:+ start:963 stop:1223 length:261 start_codon:yes stop_codon:yes gene_type:complete